MPLGIAVALGSMLAFFISISFEFGNGNFFAGISSATGYLAIYAAGVIIMAGIAATIALVAQRLIGTTITAAVVVCLLLAMIVTAYIGSKPISRFRKLVWETAPESLPIYQHEMLKSFSDGTTYTFIIAIDPDIIRDLCQAAKLSKVIHGFDLPQLFANFPDTTFPPDTDYYRADTIEMAYSPSHKKAFVVRSPSYPHSQSPQHPTNNER